MIQATRARIESPSSSASAWRFVDLHARQAVHRVIDPLLDVGQEGHSGAPVDLAQQARGVTVHVRGDRGLGVDQEAVRLRAGDEQHTVTEAAPTVHEVPGWPVVVGKEDHVDADALRVLEDLLGRAARVSRVAGVGVEDAAIVVETGQRRRWTDVPA